MVLLAELGDISRLITMTYALRYRWWVVFPGVALAAFLVHGISASIGHFLGATLPTRPMTSVSVLGLAGRHRRTRRSTTHDSRFAQLTVVSSFVLAEMSDKTTLATLKLASDQDCAGVRIGSTPGMVLADGLAIGVGTWQHQRLPAQLVHVLASLLFLVFGLWILFDSAVGWRSAAITVATAVGLAAAIAAVIHRSQTSRGAERGLQSPLGHGMSAEVPNAPTPSTAVTGVLPQRCLRGPLSAFGAGFGRAARCPDSKGDSRQIQVGLLVARDQAFPPHTACLIRSLTTRKLKRHSSSTDDFCGCAVNFVQFVDI